MATGRLDPDPCICVRARARVGLLVRVCVFIYLIFHLRALHAAAPAASVPERAGRSERRASSLGEK